MSDVGRVNWRRGLMRLWLVASATWILLMILAFSPFEIWQANQAQKERLVEFLEIKTKMERGILDGGMTLSDGTFSTPESIKADLVLADEAIAKTSAQVDSSIRDLRSTTLVALAVPFGSLVAGATCFWIGAGFSRRRK